MTLELRLSGTTVQMLFDNAHIWRGDDPQAEDVPLSRDDGLDRAVTRWFRNSTDVKLGKGRQYRGPVTVADAGRILDYIDGVAGAVGIDADADGKAEARSYARAVESAIKYLRRQGAEVGIEIGFAGIRRFEVTAPEGAEDSYPEEASPSEIPWPQGEGVFHLALSEGEWMRSPASTNRPIVGPAEVAFARYADGGIRVRVAEPS